MANIDTLLKVIIEAKYGEEVRGAIHDAIKLANDDANEAVTKSKSLTDSEVTEVKDSFNLGG